MICRETFSPFARTLPQHTEVRMTSLKRTARAKGLGIFVGLLIATFHSPHSLPEP